MVDWRKGVEAPLTVMGAGAVDWAGEADMVVIGLGGAGAAAAVQALELGQSVLALERFEGGGATKASGGVVYLGGGTAVQHEAGVEDDPEEMFRYLKRETEGVVSDELLMDYCRSGPETVEWLRRYGVRFEGTVWPKKTSYPAPEYFLYHSDNSLIAPYKDDARPAARGHRGWVPVEQGRKAINLGGSVYDPLLASALSMGLDLRRLADARQLVLDRAGRVIGVKAYCFEEGSEAAERYRKLRAAAQRWMTMYPPILPGSGFFFNQGLKRIKQAAALERERAARFFRARKGVVIAAGGFVFNRPMVQELAPKFARGFPLGTDGDDGSGILLGQSAGARLGHMDRVTAWRFINPPLAFATGLIVNRRGRRFINEMCYGAHMGVEIGENQGGKAWLIIDRALARKALAQVSGGQALGFQRDLARLQVWLAAHKANSLDELAAKVGIDAAAFAETVATYNTQARSGGRDALGKEAEDMAALETGPFYAIDIGLGAKLFPCPTLTLGGIEVDEETGQALAAEDAGVVEGLYAAGRSAVGVCSQNYVSGLSIGDCIYSGRRAARHIARSGEES